VAETAGLEACELELWRGDRRLFKQLSLAVRPGTLLHVRGPNGVGKTSLLRVLCGSSLVDTGRVLWNGVPIEAQRLQYHASLTYLGHRDGLKHDLTAVENLRFARAVRQGSDRSGLTPFSERLDETLTELELTHAAHLPVRVMSAGQRRRVAIARCLLSDAPLWILDEPFSNLDSAGRHWGDQCLARHLDGQGMVVITSHHAVEVPRHATAVLDL
jgi:heme exporter protein A